MQYIKLQLGCLVLVSYIAFAYMKERRDYSLKHEQRIFDKLLLMGIAGILFDGLTAYTVNHLDSINPVLNDILHFCFFISMDVLVYLLFLYILSITEGMPEKRSWRIGIFLPLAVDILAVIINMPTLEYRIGVSTNYSMGVSVYFCYAMVFIYIFLTILIFIRRWHYIEGRKRFSILTFLISIICVACYQSLVPEALVTSLVPTLVVLGAYMNQENPALESLEKYHKEMVMGFATLVENRDDNTGGHIRRTTAYVELLAGELKKQGFYVEELTRDYINNLIMAAPMHDIGKIAIPDAVLQKPGRLTQEEYEIMKTHSQRGGQIIKDTFGHLGEEQYEEIAYQVAQYHHEKWNGKGYPEGLRKQEIPLCARIMAIADVFDAVSAKRCYRDAMPLDACFKIIQEGKGEDFDPIIAQVFLDMRSKVEEIYEKTMEEEKP